MTACPAAGSAWTDARRACSGVRAEDGYRADPGTAASVGTGGGEGHGLLVRRPVLPADRRVGDPAERGLHDRVGAPLVAGTAGGVARVHGRGRGGSRLAQGVQEYLPARGEAAAAAVRVREPARDRVTEHGAQVLV